MFRPIRDFVGRLKFIYTREPLIPKQSDVMPMVFQILLNMLVGFINRKQKDVTDYLVAENKILEAVVLKYSSNP